MSSSAAGRPCTRPATPDAIGEGPAGAFERRREGVDRLAVHAHRGEEVAEVVDECEVHDSVAGGGGFAQHVEVGEIAAYDVRAERGDSRSRGVGPCQAGDLMAGREEIARDGRTDPARRACDEVPHVSSRSSDVIR